MPQIIELFGHFNTQETREYLEYYIKLLAEQTRLQVDFTPKELDKTLMKTLSIFREKYKSVLADVESVADAVVNKEELEAHVYSPEDDDLSTYWREELIPSLLNKLVVSRDKAVFDGIEEKYDEETLGRVEQVLLKHAENALYDYLDDGKMKRLLNRINEIKKELEKQLVEKLAKELDTPEKEPTLV